MIQKCLLPWKGKSIIVHALDAVVSVLPSARVTLAVGHLSSQVRHQLGSSYCGLSLIYDETPPGVGCRRALCSASQEGVNPVLCIHGDICVPVSFVAGLIGAWHDMQGNGLQMLTAATPHPHIAETHPRLEIENGVVCKYRTVPSPGLAQLPLSEIGCTICSRALVKRLGLISGLELSEAVEFAHTEGVALSAIVFNEPWWHFAEIEEFFPSPQSPNCFRVNA